jgi:hypothetical protein
MPTRRTAQLYATLTDRPIEVVPYGIPEVRVAPDKPAGDSAHIRFLLLGTYELGSFNRAWLQQNFSAVSGACLAVRRSVFAEAGGFDTENLSHHFYDVDFCLRLGEKKLRMVWTPYADLTLSDSAAAANVDVSQEAGYMQKRHGERRDPCYNPNLSLDPPGFTLAIPPRI